MDSLKLLHPKTLRSCISPTQKYGRNFYFGHKFDGKELFLRYYRTEPRKKWKLLTEILPSPPPKKREVHIANFRPKNMAFKRNFRPKNMARTTSVCKHGIILNHTEWACQNTSILLFVISFSTKNLVFSLKNKPYEFR